jgi:hydrogenase maturation protein HypF
LLDEPFSRQECAMQRRAITIQGVVQGVGFRPFVYELASRFHLTGFVKNQAGAVAIEVQGHSNNLDSFVQALTADPPPLAHPDKIRWEPRPIIAEDDFRIELSEGAHAGPIFVAPDVATCPDCLKELLDSNDRRYRYPFLNCTNCGPRLTIITGVPYDRAQTTMAAFPMCPLCRAEYDDPTNRRFHAQPTCCWVCGPQLRILNQQGQPIDSDDPVAFAAGALRRGQIIALKSLGGYHLACDASNAASVSQLRQRKHREEKPFAVMVMDEQAAELLVDLCPAERKLLGSTPRPIVLLRKHQPIPIAEEVAPSNPFLGIMLPCTPLHHLLLRELTGRSLVMTSGNRSNEPIAYDDADAIRRLGCIADLFVVHNRPIHVRCDDSVTRIVAGTEMPLRRSRGYAPAPISLPVRCSVPILAVGGQLKGAFALGRGYHAFVSQHLGDLDHFAAYRSFVNDVSLYQDLFAIEPRILAHDLHPEYAATRYAQQRSRQDGAKLVGIQHHHAHMASCMAEHGLNETVIGISFDGTGYGTDGAIWGGEFLIGDYNQYRRGAHFRYVGLPGGDQAIREPWRIALAHLLDSTGNCDLLENRIAKTALRAVQKMIERGLNAPPTSSVGRLFDAAASLLGIRDRVSFEGQAAIELEWAARETLSKDCFDWDLVESPQGPLQIDTRPIIRGMLTDIRNNASVSQIAGRFHATLVTIIVKVCERLRRETGLEVVALSGGVFMNVLLGSNAVKDLQQAGFRVYTQHLVPCNDGGLSLGQLAIAAAQSQLGEFSIDEHC